MTQKAPDRLLQSAALASATAEELLLSAQRAAQSMLRGGHARKRAGSGDDFWQFRPWQQGDAPRQVDWRRTARDPVDTFVRERELQTPSILSLWREDAASMFFSSVPDIPRKSDYAAVLLLALGFCALARDERVFFAGTGATPGISEARIAEAAGFYAGQNGAHPWDDALHVPRGHAVICGDFYFEPALLTERLKRVGTVSHGVAVHIYDPAEAALAPYAGRVVFSSADGRAVVDDVDGMREDYARLFAAHVAALRDAALQAGWAFLSVATARDHAEAVGDIARMLGAAEERA